MRLEQLGLTHPSVAHCICCCRLCRGGTAPPATGAATAAATTARPAQPAMLLLPPPGGASSAGVWDRPPPPAAAPAKHAVAGRTRVTHRSSVCSNAAQHPPPSYQALPCPAHRRMVLPPLGMPPPPPPPARPPPLRARAQHAAVRDPPAGGAPLPAGRCWLPAPPPPHVRPAVPGRPGGSSRRPACPGRGRSWGSPPGRRSRWCAPALSGGAVRGAGARRGG